MKGITPGNWEYRPSQSRQVVSDKGDTICKVHRGKKAQFNGPLLAASPRMYAALSLIAQYSTDENAKELARAELELVAELDRGA